MIGQLTGTVVRQGERFLILNTGGVGYKVYTTPENIAALTASQSEVAVWTHLVVREDALDLYGFPSEQELEFFELLITVSGIGPRSALAILSLAGLETLRQAIASGKSEYLTKIGGIGKKSAEKIVLELRDKVSKLGTFLPADKMETHDDVLAALETMGYTIKEAREAVKKIPTEITDTGEKIKLALKQMGKQ
ncbi:MAG: Holliday junction branch migration protein RuvA [Candidatus Vogelbacteria bacterium]|nr:Holliday junction branch migration protein RuvA [Candidatus Vogelbacteria bacterium]